ncbi:MAG TPA: ATP-binding protein [Thermoanaerobaculia bacterium]|nr:ATP-binding protein [Thermoanaerobaculia bacterium]
MIERIRRLADRRAVVVTGPRQVGKTVLLLQTADDLLSAGWPPANLTYFDFSDDRLLADVTPRQLVAAQPEGVVPDHPRALLLDEINVVPRWDRWLKQAVDTGQGLRVVATGSAASWIRAGGQESGQGRWDELRLEGLSFREFLALHSSSGEQVEATFRRERGLIDRYLAVGGFPEHARQQVPERPLAVELPEIFLRLREDIADRAIRRDLGRTGLDVERVRRLFAFLVENSGSIFKAPERARDLGADPRSVREWLERLTDTLLLVSLESYHKRAAARLRSQPKIYAADPGLVSAFSPAAQPERGRAFESAVFRHLRAAARELSADLCYFRTGDGMELDFVLQTARERIGIEVKSSVRIRAEEVKRARQAASSLGASRLLLVYGGAVSEPALDVPLVALAQFLLDPVGAVRGEETRP